MKTKVGMIMRWSVFIWILLVSNTVGLSQDGSPYITNYDLKNQYKFHNWSIIQDSNEIMLFANQKGILSFDGLSWEMIKTPAIPLTMYKDSSYKKVFVGCDNDVGFLERDISGNFRFISINEKEVDIGKVFEISSVNEKLLVLSEKYVSIYDINNHFIINRIANDNKDNLYKTIINYPGELYVVSEDNSFFKLEGDSLNFVKIKNKSNIGKILFDFPVSNKRSIIGTSKNKLYYFGGKSVWQINLQDQKYLNESILTNAVPLSDSRIAVSTLIGGILVIDIHSKKTIKTVNYSSGLPDNEIYTIGKDINNGLWLSHELGISRIDFSIPVKFYNSYPGINGRLLSVIKHNNTVYVGTSENLFFLEEIDEYKRAKLIERQIYSISKNIKSEKEIRAKEEANKKGIFKGLQKKIKKIISPEDQISISEKKRDALIRNRKLLGLQSVSHQYIKIKNLDDRCKILVPFGDKLLVGGNNGVYEVFENEAVKIISDFYINNIIADKNNPNLFYICTNNGLLLMESVEDEWKINEIKRLNSEIVSHILTTDTSIWAGTNNNVFLVDTSEYDAKEYFIENRYSESMIIEQYNNNVFILLPSQILYYDHKLDSIVSLSSSQLSFINTQASVLWVNYEGRWKPVIKPENYNLKGNMFLKLFSNIEYLYIDYDNNTWVIDDNNNLYNINNLPEDVFKYNQNLFIKNLTSQTGINYSMQNLVLEPDENYLGVMLSAPYFIKQNAVEYKYFLEGLMKDWSEWGTNAQISFPYIPHGNYTLHVKVKNILGVESEEKSISFSIKEPYWKKKWFLISSGLSFFLCIIIIIRLRERKLQKNKRILEAKIKERTRTIEEQKDQIAISHKNIKDSITYAKRIQKAIMPSKEIIHESFEEYFVYFRPRDIVSGDFYWLKKIGDYTVYAVADCTGHGVPGALLSMLGISFLSEIVTKARFDSPDEILNRLRKKVKQSLKQSNKDDDSKDGMDIALCVIDHESLELQFAGAYNPVYILRKGELSELKATRNPIGYHLKEQKFQNNVFQLQKGDVLYTFSDGYTDQFGEKGNTKFNKTNFKKLIKTIAGKPMKEQKDILETIFLKWKGSNEQTDDIIVMGVRI